MLNVLCLKHGSKYPADYVNRLAHSVARNLAVPCRFVCFTDNAHGIDPGIKIITLPKDSRFNGWWWKPYMFKAGLFDDGDTCLFFDLDMVIVKDIHCLVNYLPGKFLGMRDVFRAIHPKTRQLGSAVMRWPANKFTNIWSQLNSNPSAITRFRGDQTWIQLIAGSAIEFYPDEWIRSYKWEVRSKDELVRNAQGEWEFTKVSNPTLEPETCVLAFHGTPHLRTCRDPVIVRHWH